MTKRDLMLNAFKANGEFGELCGLTKKQIEVVSFRDDKVQDPVVMSLKKNADEF